MLGGLLSGLWPYVMSAGLAVLALLGVYAKGRKDASGKAAHKADKKRADDMATAKDIRNDVDGKSSGDLRDALNGWMRDNRK